MVHHHTFPSSIGTIFSLPPLSQFHDFRVPKGKDATVSQVGIVAMMKLISHSNYATFTSFNNGPFKLTMFDMATRQFVSCISKNLTHNQKLLFNYAAACFSHRSWMIIVVGPGAMYNFSRITAFSLCPTFSTSICMMFVRNPEYIHWSIQKICVSIKAAA